MYKLLGTYQEEWEKQTINVTGFAKRDLIAHFEKIELLLP